MTKKSFKVDGMHCTSCALVIESDLEDEGVKASVSYAKQTLDVEFDDQKVNIETIKTVVTRSGYRIK